jgi:hypothetical protein
VTTGTDPWNAVRPGLGLVIGAGVGVLVAALGGFAVPWSVVIGAAAGLTVGAAAVRRR